MRRSSRRSVEPTDTTLPLRRVISDAAIRRARVIAMLVLTVHFAVMAFRPSSALGQRSLADFSVLVGCIAALWMCRYARRYSTGRMRNAWNWMAASVLASGIGWAIQGYVEIGSPLNSARTVSAAAPFFFVGIQLSTVALLCLPIGRTNAALRARTLLDGIIIALAVLVVAWALTLNAAVGSVIDGPQPRLFVTLVFATDIAFLPIVWLAWLRARVNAPHLMPFLAMLAAGKVLASIGSLGLSSAISGNVDANRWFTTGWFGLKVFIILAAMEFLRSRRVEQRQAITHAPSLFMAVLPYVAVMIVLATTLAYMLLNSEVDFVLSGLVSSIVVLAMIRQFILVRENLALTGELEAYWEDRHDAMTRSEHRLTALLGNSTDVIAIIRPNGTTSYIGPSVENVFGIPGETFRLQLEDQGGRNKVHPLRVAVAAALTGSQFDARVEWTLIDGAGCIRFAESHVSDLRHDPIIGGVVINTRDITQQKQLEDRLIFQAYHDVLTGLANRALFSERLRVVAGRDGERADFAVLYCDLDRFKSVNDTFGHGVGDRLLVLVAERLNRCVRPGDVVARLGGDEFAVLIGTNGDPTMADRIAVRIKASLNEPFDIDGNDVSVGVSVGIAHPGESREDVEELMRTADKAMYLAKAEVKAKQTTA